MWTIDKIDVKRGWPLNVPGQERRCDGLTAGVSKQQLEALTSGSMWPSSSIIPVFTNPRLLHVKHVLNVVDHQFRGGLFLLVWRQATAKVIRRHDTVGEYLTCDTLTQVSHEQNAGISFPVRAHAVKLTVLIKHFWVLFS